MASGVIPLFGGGPWTGRLEYKAAARPEYRDSSVEVSCFLKRTDGKTVSGSFTGELYIGIVRKSFHFSKVGPDFLFVGSAWAEVPHRDDGAGNCLIRANIRGAGGTDLSGKTLQTTKNVILDTITLPKPSGMTLGADRAKMGSTLKITLSRNSDSVKHDLSYIYGSQSGVIGKGVGTSCTWTIPDLTQEPGLSGTCTVVCRSYVGPQALGEVRKTLTLEVPDPLTAQAKNLTLGRDGEILCPGRPKNFTLSLCLILSGREYAVGRGKQERFLFTPAYALGKLQPDKRILSATLRCESFQGSQSVGVRDTAVTIAVPENEMTRPRITALTLKPRSQGIPGEYGYLRGKTGMEASVAAEYPCSGPGKVSLTLGSTGVSGNPAVIPLLEEAGKLQARIRVEDQRGYFAEEIREVLVLPYEKPRILPPMGGNQVICGRAEASGALSDTGTFLKIRAEVGTTGLGFQGEIPNTPKLSCRIKQENGAFGGSTELLQSGSSQADALLSGLSKDSSYVVELKARDLLGETTVVLYQIQSETISFGLYDGPDGAAFGKYPESPHVVDLGPQMTLLVRGRLSLPGEVWQDLALAPGIPEAAGKTSGVRYRVHGGNQVYVSLSCGMPQAYKALNRDPLPDVLRPKEAVYGLCPSEGGAVLAVLGTDGFLKLQTLAGKANPAWVQGMLSYFT